MCVNHKGTALIERMKTGEHDELNDSTHLCAQSSSSGRLINEESTEGQPNCSWQEICHKVCFTPDVKLLTPSVHRKSVVQIRLVNS